MPKKIAPNGLVLGLTGLIPKDKTRQMAYLLTGDAGSSNKAMMC